MDALSILPWTVPSHPQSDSAWWHFAGTGPQEERTPRERIKQVSKIHERGGLLWVVSVWTTKNKHNRISYSLPSMCPDAGVQMQTCSSNALSTSQWQDITALTLSYFSRNQTDFCLAQFIWSLPKEWDWHMVKCLGRLWKNISSRYRRCQDESSPTAHTTAGVRSHAPPSRRASASAPLTAGVKSSTARALEFWSAVAHLCLGLAATPLSPTASVLLIRGGR